MLEGTNLRNTVYFRFSIAQTLTDIWKGMIAYQMRFHRIPEVVYYSPFDDKVHVLLGKLGLKEVTALEEVPSGQIWMYVPGGYTEEIQQ